MSKTADWQSKARVLINLSIRERFRIFMLKLSQTVSTDLFQCICGHSGNKFNVLKN